MIKGLFVVGKYWQLIEGINGYAHQKGDELVTQAKKGRVFRILEPFEHYSQINLDSRIKVNLLEDGYNCLFSISDLIENVDTIFWNQDN